jgi:hypothetical protein
VFVDAAPVNVTVQVPDDPELSVAGQATLLSAGVLGVTDWIVSVDPAPVIITGSAAGEVAPGLVIPIDIVVALAAVVRFTVATTPLAIAVAFNPLAMHRYWPFPPAHVTIFPALVDAAPVATLIALIFETGYEIVHSKAAT